MDQASDDEHTFFTNMLKKSVAKKTKINRKNILQQKKSKRLKTKNEKNTEFLTTYIDQASSSIRTPLISIDTNIPTQVSIYEY